VLFSGLSSSNYPVYNKNSLINTNSEFDYSTFVELATDLTVNGEAIDSFVFSFDEAGFYDFYDSSN